MRFQISFFLFTIEFCRIFAREKAFSLLIHLARHCLVFLILSFSLLFLKSRKRREKILLERRHFFLFFFVEKPVDSRYPLHLTETYILLVFLLLHRQLIIISINIKRSLLFSHEFNQQFVVFFQHFTATCC